ncbi:hypothetical protein [Butyrivibrio sp. AE3006]|uniref:hypothetical protein n=1 Tax=Butyrivibrio sp. AE3006 TaxID=1280673 RepID=UPI0012DC59CA|nr:hypothetical protein [Butyrivibrio sp. AE3006]
MVNEINKKNIDFWKNIILKLALSLIVTSLLGTYVRTIAKSFLPKEKVEISYGDTENPVGDIYIVDSDEPNDLFSRIEKEADSAGCEIIEDEYGNKSVVLKGDSENHISIKSAMKMNAFMAVKANSDSGNLAILKDDKEKRIDLSNLIINDGQYRKIYPFGEEKLPILIYVGIYLFFFLVVCEAVFFVLPVVSHGIVNSKLLGREVGVRHFIISMLAIYVYDIVQYKNGIINFLEFGDQIYYWVIDLFKDGAWNPAKVAAQTATFRGYLCNFAPTISNKVATILGIDPVYIYFVFTSASAAWLFFMVLPGIYFTLVGRKATLLNAISSLLIFIVFWNGMLTAVLVDLFAVSAFFSGIWMLLRCYREKKLIYSVFFGIFVAVSCNLRMAYKYGWAALLVVFFISMLIKRIIKINYKVCLAIFIAMSSFVLISIPQFDVNREKGHFGFFPYNSIYTEEQTLMELGMNISLGKSYTTYPFEISDAQQASMESALYTSEEYLSLEQIFGVYLHSPIESLIYLAKKMFLTFDIKTNVTYPDRIEWRKTSGLLFSLMNYYILISALFIFFRTKRLNENEKLISYTLFASLVLPEMIMNIEWRYFISIYILLYYFYAYHFWECLSDDNGDIKAAFRREEYFICLLIGIVMSFLLSLSMFAK